MALSLTNTETVIRRNKAIRKIRYRVCLCVCERVRVRACVTLYKLGGMARARVALLLTLLSLFMFGLETSSQNLHYPVTRHSCWDPAPRGAREGASAVLFFIARSQAREFAGSGSFTRLWDRTPDRPQSKNVFLLLVLLFCKNIFPSTYLYIS